MHFSVGDVIAVHTCEARDAGAGLRGKTVEGMHVGVEEDWLQGDETGA